jgi:two-component system, response regulator FlrC
VNILVVDDEAIQVESLRRGLVTKGFHVVEALNAEEALRHLNTKEERIDLVLTDYAMPGMNGIDLLKTIRQSHVFLPVIVMTAYGEKKEIVESFCDPHNGFLLKPFTLDNLVQEIEKVKES